MELIVAIPAAAADPDRNIVGMLHRGGFAELIPTLTSVRAATTATTEVDAPARAKPAAAMRQAMTTCQVRSPVWSEWRAQRIMAKIAAVGGIVLRSPTCIVDSPNCLMI